MASARRQRPDDVHGFLPAQSCWCCGAKVERRELGDPWEGRMDGYCYACALNRCDCYPETCPAKSSDQEDANQSETPSALEVPSETQVDVGSCRCDYCQGNGRYFDGCAKEDA